MVFFGLLEPRPEECDLVELGISCFLSEALSTATMMEYLGTREYPLSACVCEMSVLEELFTLWVDIDRRRAIGCERYIAIKGLVSMHDDTGTRTTTLYHLYRDGCWILLLPVIDDIFTEL